MTTQQTISDVSPLQKIDRGLSDIFGSAPMEISVVKSEKELPPDTDNELDADAAFVRSNMYSIIQQGNDALSYALELAKQVDNPRGFEVVGGLLKNLADMNMQMLDMHGTKQKLKTKIAVDAPGPNVVNNSIVFQGSTSDLNRMLDGMKKTNKDL